MGWPAYLYVRLSADVVHLSAILSLIWSIYRNRSAEGVSLITQSFYLLVFVSRYADLFQPYSWYSSFIGIWNIFFKFFYILSAGLIVHLMLHVFARTREREKAWKFGFLCLVGTVMVTPFAYWKLEDERTVTRFFWVFSEVLESVAVLPQLLLLRQTTVPTVFDSFYLIALGSYRALYMINWIFKRAHNPEYSDPISWVFGTIQTMLYVDFAWVYYTRQRVKLHHGGIVDSDDMGRGLIVGRLLGRQSNEVARDEEDPPQGGAAAAGPRTVGSRWGRRGISVSADDTLGARNRPETEPLTDPDAFEDDIDEPDHVEIPSDSIHGVSNGDEWRDDHEEDRR